jgi:hypothetical protein
MSTINGTNGDDFLVDDNATDDRINGKGGDDIILGGTGNETILGGSGNDWVLAQDGNDVIFGGSGNDIIDAGNGNNKVFGGSGSDYLTAGSGNDMFSTGAGADVVAYTQKDVGIDVITDFNVHQDTLDLHALTGLSFDQLVFQDVNGGTLITSSDPSLMTGSIFLNGVKSSELNDSNLLTAAACFLRGTLIDTPEGERAVETLAIGDLVSTLDGVSRPVKWIGLRSFQRRFVGAKSEANPVVFKAGSLGHGLPHADLSVSGKHAMFFDGVFVRAEDLVNGTTVTRDSRIELIEYFHVELDTADVIFANGAATETYANHNSRRMFTNWRDYVDLYGSEDAVEPNAAGEFDRLYPLVTDPDVISALLGTVEEAAPLRRAA